mmetsp:Transcript_14766/g.51764  ORF Transcript_14766/g.51764 Transcript_14766/m.51764 type:complete len:551 (-) Transcript_14766:97-1749(-)
MEWPPDGAPLGSPGSAATAGFGSDCLRPSSGAADVTSLSPPRRLPRSPSPAARSHSLSPPRRRPGSPRPAAVEAEAFGSPIRCATSCSPLQHRPPLAPPSPAEPGASSAFFGAGPSGAVASEAFALPRGCAGFSDASPSRSSCFRACAGLVPSWDFPLSTQEKRDRAMRICEKEVWLASRHADRRGQRLWKMRAQAAAQVAVERGRRHEVRFLRLEAETLKEENRWLRERVRSLLAVLVAADQPSAVASAFAGAERLEVQRRCRRSYSGMGGSEGLTRLRPGSAPAADGLRHWRSARLRLRRLRREVREARGLAAKGRRALREVSHSCGGSRCQAAVKTSEGDAGVACESHRAVEKQAAVAEHELIVRALQKELEEQAQAQAFAAEQTETIQALRWQLKETHVDEEALQALRLQLQEKDVFIASLRVQAELVGVRKGLEQQLAGGQDFDSRCHSLMESLSRLMHEPVPAVAVRPTHGFPGSPLHSPQRGGGGGGSPLADVATPLRGKRRNPAPGSPQATVAPAQLHLRRAAAPPPLRFDAAATSVEDPSP